MSRKIKNIIMIGIILIVAVLSFFTMDDVKSNMGGNNMLDKNREFEQRGEMPSRGESPSDDQMSSMKNNNSNGTNQTPPTKPEGENINNDRQNAKIDRPSNFNKEDIENMPDDTKARGYKIATSYYVLFGLEAFIINMLLIYLIMSNFNNKNVIETLKGSKKIIIYFILVIGLTIGLTFLQRYLTNNVFTNRNVSQMQNRNTNKRFENIIQWEESSL